MDNVSGMLMTKQWHGALIRMRAHDLNMVETDTTVTSDEQNAQINSGLIYY